MRSENWTWISPHIVTGHFTGCTFHCSTRIALAVVRSTAPPESLSRLHVPLLHQNRYRLIAKPFHLRLRQQLPLHQMLDLTVQTRTRRHRFQSLSLSLSLSLNAQIRTTEIADFMNQKPYKNSNHEPTDLCEESPKPIYKVLRYRKSRMKQRFRTHRERQGQDLATEKPKEDSEFSKKETAEPTVQSQEPIRTMSSTSSFEKQASRTESPPFTTSSNSSGVKPSSQTESPPFLLCPDLSSNQRMSPRTLDHPNATKNIKNLPPSPIPTSRTRIANYDKDNDMYRLNSVHRSASTRDFRRTSLRNQFDVHAYGDY